MATAQSEQDEILNAIRDAAEALGHSPSFPEFEKHSGMKRGHIWKHFLAWTDAVCAAGLKPQAGHFTPIAPEVLNEDKENILNKIREAAKTLGRLPTRKEFLSLSGMKRDYISKRCSTWTDAVRAAGLEPNLQNRRIDPDALLEDWGRLVRKIHRIPTRNHYYRDGNYTLSTFDKNFNSWYNVPRKFREFADGKPEWADVVALLPIEHARVSVIESPQPESHSTHAPSSSSGHRHAKLSDRTTYGNPIDFRGLRHEPVNENGVVFLFGMVARELGYLVEAVQAGFPDCEAKRQIDAGKWQRVRIEFEFESRNFRDHGHPPEGCDVIVCWRHNWPDCPDHIEVVELSRVIQTLAPSDE